MIINLVIILLIVIVLCNSVIYSNKYKCPSYSLKIDYVRGSRLPGTIYSEKVGVDTINLKLDRDVPCGIYNLKNAYGDAVLHVGHGNPRFGYMAMKDMSAIANINLFDLWDLHRQESEENYFVQTYNRGCC